MFVELIKHLITNGCSYTVGRQWDAPLAVQYNINQHNNWHNLAKVACGNEGIAKITVEFLETYCPPPSETIVVIMWSGIGRVDLPISKDWANYLKNEPHVHMQHGGPNNESSYLLSGGHASWCSWNANKTSKKVFEPLYKLRDENTMCKQSLLHFIMLERYLEAKGYQFFFTSFVNYWEENEPIYNEGMCISTVLKDDPLFQNYSMRHWLDIETLGSYGYRTDGIVDMHPTEDCSRNWSETVLIPAINLRLSR